MERKVVRYSEAFKLRVVSALESGELGSLEEARRVHGIGGQQTVKKWVRRYGRNHLLAKVVRVETPDERREIERLRAENRKLKEALADTRMEQLLDRAYLEVWCEDRGLDLEAEKKRLAAELSRRRGTEGGKPGSKT